MRPLGNFLTQSIRSVRGLRQRSRAAFLAWGLVVWIGTWAGVGYRPGSTAQGVEVGGWHAIKADDEYQARVAPLLSKNCVACHNAKSAEGGLNLEGYAEMMAGGDSGPTIVPGDVDSSELIARMRATDDSVMPPDDNGVGAERLTAEQIEWVAQWVAAGAEPPAAGAETRIQWREISEAVRPIYAVQLSRDGHYLSFAKGNVAYIVPQPLREGPWQPQPLLDPDLELADGTALTGTDKDLIHSLAFSHDGQRLAVGGFRTVKVWQRQVQAQVVDAAEPATEGTEPAALVVLPTQGEGPGPVAIDANQQLVIATPSRTVQQTLGTPTRLAVAAAWSEGGASLTVMTAEGALERWASNPEAADGSWTGQPLTTAEAWRATRSDESTAPLVVGLVTTGPQQWLVVLRSGQVWRAVMTDETGRWELAFDLERSVQWVSSSADGQSFLVGDAAGSVTLWRTTDGQLTQTLGEDYQRWQRRQQSQAQIARQEGWIQRLNEMLPGLEAAVKQEEEARGKVAESHQQAVAAREAKELEIAAAQQTFKDTEQAIAALEQQLAEMRKNLETQQKSVVDLEAQRGPLEQNVAKAAQALASADAGLQLAQEKIPAQQTRIEAQQQTLAESRAAWEQFESVAAPPVIAGYFDSEHAQLLLLDRRGRGLLYRSEDGRPVAVLEPPTGFEGSETASLSAVASGQVTVAANGSLWRWDLGLPWELQQTFGSENTDVFSFRVTALAFSPDDRTLAVGSGPPSRYGDLKVLSLETGQVERDFGQVHSDTILALEYSPDGRWLASAGADKLCRLHDPQTGAMVKILEGHTHFVQGLSWHRQAQTLATASADKTVKTWDVETGERRQSIGGFGKELSAIAYVGDTDQVLTVSLDGQPRLHRGGDAQLVRGFSSDAQPLYALTVSADGQHGVVGDHTGRVRIYKVEDGQLLRQWPE